LNLPGMNAASFSSMNRLTWGDLKTSMKALSRRSSFFSGLAVKRSEAVIDQSKRNVVRRAISLRRIELDDLQVPRIFNQARLIIHLG